MQKFILFDFDGVIADSFGAALDINKMIYEDITEEEYKRAFEGNINQWIKESPLQYKKSTTEVDFSTEYASRMKNSVYIVPGMAEIIKELAESYTLIVISSTISGSILEFIQKYSLRDYFKEILGNDIHHSKVEKIKMVFEKYAIHADQCVFITDTLGDMIEAEKTDVGAIGVSWGFHSEETLKKGKPFKIVNKPEELSEAVSEYFN